MSFRLPPDALAAVASFIMIIELHICASHLSDDAIRDRRPNWDYEFRRSKPFFDDLVSTMACRSKFRRLQTIPPGTFSCTLAISI